MGNGASSEGPKAKGRPGTAPGRAPPSAPRLPALHAASLEVGLSRCCEQAEVEKTTPLARTGHKANHCLHICIQREPWRCYVTPSRHTAKGRRVCSVVRSVDGVCV
jgi:hypothetical protein